MIRSVGGALLLSLWICATSLATPFIEPIGILGNSGGVGRWLVRVGDLPFDQCATGVAADDEFTLWLSGGDAINRIGLDGRLVERFPLEPKGSFVNSRTFAVSGSTLYFIGQLPDGQTTLFSLPMKGSEGRAARPLALRLPNRKRDYMPYCLAPQPFQGQLVISCEPQEFADERIGVYFINPNTDPPFIRLAFSIPGSSPYGIAVDEGQGIFYIGGYFGWFVGGETHPNVHAIMAVRVDGVPLEGFPVACPKTPAIPTQFRGMISLAGGALWDTAWYGFLARLDLGGRGAPGRVVEWHHEIGYPTQVICLGEKGDRQLLAITTAMPDALYLAHWDKGAQQLIIVRRIGCLPVIASLGLSEDGWVTVGTMRTQLWWRWEDAADAPPRKAELHIATTPGFFNDNRFFSFAAQYRLDDLKKCSPVPAVFTSRVGDRNEAQRLGEPVPIRRPTGLTVQIEPGESEATLYVSDTEAKQIWKTRLWLPDMRPDPKGWQPIRIEGEPLLAPTDLVALADGRLLLADEGRILLLMPKGNALQVVQRFDRWGEGAGERFGKQLRIAVDGPWLLVSDTQRHRIIWLDWTEWKVLAMFGRTDEAGDDPWHLNEPTLVAIRGTKAIVADSGNQRLLRLRLAP